MIIYDSPGAVQPSENVLFQTANQTGTTVEGVTNQTNTMVFFTSNEPLRTTGSEGQSRLGAVDGSLDQVLFGLSDMQLTFTEAEFNLFNAFPDTSTVTITLSSGLTQTFDLAPNGQNFFGVRATDGDTLTSVNFNTNGSGVSDLRQVRIGGISSQIGAVPEPTTWAMMLFGFGA
ncbi:PEP-CTERM sorting domain-containing protein, partial [Altererythrobacter sp. SALINAS58]|uniref:PEP-CTERM sorting domain-containing protein n=1 Tax=Alteripontixanthobacter muriae TaxID=2705546 RepID=UPI001576C4B8